MELLYCNTLEGVARLKDLRFLNLSVFEGNPARALSEISLSTHSRA